MAQRRHSTPRPLHRPSTRRCRPAGFPAPRVGLGLVWACALALTLPPGSLAAPRARLVDGVLVERPDAGAAPGAGSGRETETSGWRIGGQPVGDLPGMDEITSVGRTRRSDTSTTGRTAPSARRDQGAWLVAGVGRAAGGSRLALAMVDEGTGRAVAIASPADPAAAVQRDPVWIAWPHAEGEALLLWIEGPHARATAVRSARWTGTAWAATRTGENGQENPGAGARPETVTLAPPGPGSQIALTAIALSGPGPGSGGRALAVWTAFDGTADETVYSVRSVEGNWSRPRPIGRPHGRPDILPALAADGRGGALAAWSRYDGSDYRVVTARFDGARWTEPAWVGPAGSVEASLAAVPDPGGGTTIALTYRRVLPAGWEVLALDRRGRGAETPVRIGEALAPPRAVARGDEAPWVEARTVTGYRMRWASTGERFEIARPAP